VPVAVVLVKLKKHAKKSDIIRKDNNKPGSPQETETDHQPVPVPERAARHVERFQPSPSSSTLSLGCCGAGITGPAAWN